MFGFIIGSGILTVKMAAKFEKNILYKRVNPCTKNKMSNSCRCKQKKNGSDKIKLKIYLVFRPLCNIDKNANVLIF